MRVLVRQSKNLGQEEGKGKAVCITTTPPYPLKASRRQVAITALKAKKVVLQIEDIDKLA